MSAFSLPTQRCFFFGAVLSAVMSLFSAYAEVFLVLPMVLVFYITFLCLRRGVSYWGSIQADFLIFSLPTQRCFFLAFRRGCQLYLFSAYAEVFPCGSLPRRSSLPFLCLRRGVSGVGSGRNVGERFSLPTQRCFWVKKAISRQNDLFSAYAEVFPRYKAFSQDQPAFLCLRRGVSSRCEERGHY